MGLLNFKEISRANISDGKQDTFELFAREFFHSLGFQIAVDPDRGQDGGRDLIIVEKRSGILNDSEIRWLVSCKHKAHSGTSVNVSDEEDIGDRVSFHGCNGFIGFYSTVISSPLSRKFEGLRENFEIQIFDNEKIERVLLENKVVSKLIKRFFPKSYSELNMKSPSNLLDEYVPLKCEVCGKDLLHRSILDDYRGVIVMVEDMEYYKRTNGKIKYVDVYCACKGACDTRLENYYFKMGYSNGWNDISDLIIPYHFLEFCMGIINRLRDDEDSYTDDAFTKMKNYIIGISQIVMKNQSEDDIKRIKALRSIPRGL